MDSMKFLFIFGIFCVLKISAEPPVPRGIKPSNILGGSGQHASFSFVRPGLTQTSYSFNGPSSHQAFSSSIGNPNLAQKVLPNVANALAYRNPGLGYFQNGPIAGAYATTNPQYQQSGPIAAQPGPLAPTGQIVYQQSPVRASEGQVDQTSALNAYLQQQYEQQYRQYYHQQYLQAQQQYQAQNFQDNSGQQQDNSVVAAYQAQLAQLHAFRQAPSQAQTSEQLQQLPEQIQLQQQQDQQQQQQQQQQTQNLLGVAYSSAPSVAHVKVNGNGYNFDF